MSQLRYPTHLWNFFCFVILYQQTLSLEKLQRRPLWCGSCWPAPTRNCFHGGTQRARLACSRVGDVRGRCGLTRLGRSVCSQTWHVDFIRTEHSTWTSCRFHFLVFHGRLQADRAGAAAVGRCVALVAWGNCGSIGVPFYSIIWALGQLWVNWGGVLFNNLGLGAAVGQLGCHFILLLLLLLC